MAIFREKWEYRKYCENQQPQIARACIYCSLVAKWWMTMKLNAFASKHVISHHPVIILYSTRFMPILMTERHQTSEPMSGQWIKNWSVIKCVLSSLNVSSLTDNDNGDECDLSYHGPNHPNRFHSENELYLIRRYVSLSSSFFCLLLLIRWMKERETFNLTGNFNYLYIRPIIIPSQNVHIIL